MGFMNALGEIVVAIVGGILQLFVELASVIGKKDHSQKATFGDKKSVLSHSKSASVYIGDDAIDPMIAMNSSIILGRTGSGKSAMVYKPSLLQTPSPKIEEGDSASMSYVVLDPAGELERDTGGYNHEKGYHIDILSFSDAKKSTAAWNPIEGLSDSEVSRFATEYIETALKASKVNDPFWPISASRVTRLVINVVRLFPGYANLYNARYVVQLMSSNAEELDVLMSLPVVPEELFNEYASIVGMGDKLKTSVLATTLAALEIFSDPEIAKITSSSTLNMEAYREQSNILYVQTPVMDQEHAAILNTMLFSRFFSYCMSASPEDHQNSIAFLIDECSSLRMRPSLLPLAVSNLRKYRSFGVFGFQSAAQIRELYGQEHAQTILQNAGTKLFFPGQDLSTSEELSRLLGRYDWKDEEGRIHSRNLLNPDEISFLKKKNGALLFSGNERGIVLSNIRPWYKNRRLVKRSKIESKERDPVDAHMPSLLPITDIIKRHQV
ncbi:MAG: type IV secretory system conjugative DNA transfer family protein [bacterium]|nr:type IV secretory system conjugative DNA transfer family protein [bacterium]